LPVTDRELDIYIKEALKQLAYEALPALPGEPPRVVPDSRAQQIAGRWEGSAVHPIREGTLLSLPGEQEQGIVVEHVISARTALRITFESSEDEQFSGDGELDIDLSQLDITYVKSVYTDITGEALQDGCFAFEAQNIEDAGSRMYFKATLSDDGQTLTGTYQAVGLLTNEAVTGEFYMQKVQKVTEGCEVITVDPIRKIVDLIWGATKSILVTHFTPEIPPKEYIEAMLERLRDDVTITRIVAFLPGVPKEVYSWLNNFRKEGALLPYYKESQYIGTPLPFDIMVIDDKVAVQGFADYPEARAYSSIICHYDSHIARRFRETIEAMKSNQYELTQHSYP
jgi:hypothetical protein